MWYSYTVDYYSAIKNSDIMKFAGKLMELEKINLSDETQTQKDIHDLYSLISGYYSKTYGIPKIVHRTQRGYQDKGLE